MSLRGPSWLIQTDRMKKIYLYSILSQNGCNAIAIIVWGGIGSILLRTKPNLPESYFVPCYKLLVVLHTNCVYQLLKTSYKYQTGSINIFQSCNCVSVVVYSHVLTAGWYGSRGSWVSMMYAKSCRKHYVPEGVFPCWHITPLISMNIMQSCLKALNMLHVPHVLVLGCPFNKNIFSTTLCNACISSADPFIWIVCYQLTHLSSDVCWITCISSYFF